MQPMTPPSYLEVPVKTRHEILKRKSVSVRQIRAVLLSRRLKHFPSAIES